MLFEQKLQMSQKFISSVQKTVKKSYYFTDQKPKRFTRKRSERDRSFDSKRSKEDSIFEHYIKTPKHNNANKINITNNTELFLEQLDTSAAIPTDNQTKCRKNYLTRTNVHHDNTRQQCTLTLKIKILETQLRAKEGQSERFKLQAEDERDRRRKAQSDRKTYQRESAAFQKQNQELLLQIKKLTKQKEILNKQIQFLEKINYDDKTRNIQSFRQMHMNQQLSKLREQIISKKTQNEIEYEKELQQLRHDKDIAYERFRSMESLVQVLKRKVQHWKEELIEERTLTKERIIHSEQYHQLRDRFKKFIEQYKDIRNENINLKKLIQTKQTQLVLSDEEHQRN